MRELVRQLYVIRAVPAAVAVALCAAIASPASANTGVAFVHGTGHQTNALADYWTSPFVNTVRSGLPNTANYTVINCDFT